LGVTDRWVRKLLLRVKREGDGGIVHRLRGQASNRRLAQSVRAKVGPKSSYFAFTNINTRARTLSAKRRFDSLPRCRPLRQMSALHLTQYLQPVTLLRVHHQRLLFSHPASLTVRNRNFPLCWITNFSLCCGTRLKLLPKHRNFW